jgi:TonB-dependent SusC/RagA subfamily outer membrane receptor
MDYNVRDLQEESSVRSTTNIPLFILDGFEVSLQRVMDMDNEQVQSITLLKDASATALYGARGANGIVVITSRRPGPGQLRVSYRGTLSIEAPDFTSYNLMNAREKLVYEEAAGLYIPRAGHDNTFAQGLKEEYARRLVEVERGVDTYWLKYPVRTTAGNRHSLRIDGGAESFLYAAGLSYNNIAGVMKKSSRNTLSGNLFFQYEYKNVKFQNDITIAYNKSYNSPYGSFSEYTLANPIYAPYDDKGRLVKMLSDKFAAPTYDEPALTANPLYNASLPTRDDAQYTSIQNNFAVEWHISPDLFIRGRFGFTKQDDRSDRYLSRDHTSFETDYYSGENYRLRGSYTYGTGNSFAYETDLTLNYNKTIGDVHQIYAGLNMGMAESMAETFSVIALGFSATNKDNIGLAAGYPENGKPTTTEQHSRRLSATLNVNYIYDNRYFADLSGKLEGSSKVGVNNRTAPFWSAGLG